MKVRFVDIRFAGILALAACAVVGVAIFQLGQPTAAREPQRDIHTDKYTTVVRPLVQKYCLGCHSTKARKGSLDLERFPSIELVRKDLKPWQQAIEMLEAAEMPPKGKPQPTSDERKQLIAWIRGFLDAEARARTGDPGYVPLRRLSNAEYDSTIRDLTGVDLRPTREFPADGAAKVTESFPRRCSFIVHAWITPDGHHPGFSTDLIIALMYFYISFASDLIYCRFFAQPGQSGGPRAG